MTEQEWLQDRLDFWRKELRKSHFDEDMARREAKAASHMILAMKRQAQLKGYELK